MAFVAGNVNALQRQHVLTLIYMTLGVLDKLYVGDIFGIPSFFIHVSGEKIALVQDLPVGNNFQDHMMVDYYVSIDEPISITPERAASFSSLIRYRLTGAGRDNSYYIDIAKYRVVIVFILNY